jgi:2-phospho-L-lactate transferase/gluconeogenesis factor (CofD/UPF0052 family)
MVVVGPGKLFCRLPVTAVHPFVSSADIKQAVPKSSHQAETRKITKEEARTQASPFADSGQDKRVLRLKKMS